MISLYCFDKESVNSYRKGRPLWNAYRTAGIVLCTFTHQIIAGSPRVGIIIGHWDVEKLDDFPEATLLVAGKRWTDSRTHCLTHALIRPYTIQPETLDIQQICLKRMLQGAVERTSSSELDILGVGSQLGILWKETSIVERREPGTFFQRSKCK